MEKTSDGYSPRDVTGSGAERHTNADFAAALQHRVIQHTVQADGGESQSDDGKEQRQHGQQPFADGGGLVDLQSVCGY